MASKSGVFDYQGYVLERNLDISLYAKNYVNSYYGYIDMN